MNLNVRTIRYAILGMLAALLLLCTIIASNYGFIEVKVNDKQDGAFFYSITEADQAETKTNETQSSVIRKLVKKDAYIITANQDDRQAFALKKSRGFFMTEKVNLSLTEERERTFIGNNPAGCMNLFGDKLISYQCDGFFHDLNRHEPASTNQPTYVTKNSTTDVIGAIEGIHDTTNGRIMLLRDVADPDTGEIGPQAIYSLSDDQNASNAQPVQNLKADKIYATEKYKNGFIAYDTNLDDIYEFPDGSANARQINVERPKNGQLFGHALRASNDTIVLTYSEEEQGDDIPLSLGNELVILTAGKQKNYKIKGHIAYAQSCGEQKICILRDEVFEVYKTGRSLSLETSVPFVRMFEVQGDSVILVRDKDVLRISTVTWEGSVEYAFGEYSFCGYQSVTSGYLLCVIDKRSNKSVLLINRDQKNSDSIDKRINALNTVPELESYSIYRSIIFVTPRSGELEYDTETNVFGFNDETIRSNNQKIDEAITEAGIDRTKYSIVKTIDR